jgi:beta-galactosidase GanA
MVPTGEVAGIRFGAADYPEYQPSLRLDAGFNLMQQAGFTVIRVGEAVWSIREPEPGVFDLHWMQPVLDGAHARGIGVNLGTPPTRSRCGWARSCTAWSWAPGTRGFTDAAAE